MRRYKSHTPAARLRDAPARSRRRRRAALAGSAVVFAVVLGGVAISVSGPPRVSTAAWTGGSGQEAGPDLDADADAVTRPPTPDGHVHLDEAGGPHRLPAGWADVPAVLTGAVDAAGDDGLDLSLCVRAIDSPTAPMRCAGGVERAYAASVTKLAYAVGALEAWEGDAEAEAPLGATVGDLVDQAISVSDNEAADLLALLSASGPGALDADPFTAINTVTARVGLDDDFHSGNYYTEDHWYLSADESSLDAASAARYLTELVRAADDDRSTGRPLLTDPGIARYVLDAMLEQERTDKIPGELPAGTAANKTGETDTVSHDLAVVNTAQGRLVVAMVSSADGLGGGPDEVVAEAAAEVVDLFGGPVTF